MPVIMNMIEPYIYPKKETDILKFFKSYIIRS